MARDDRQPDPPRSCADMRPQPPRRPEQDPARANRRPHRSTRRPCRRSPCRDCRAGRRPRESPSAMTEPAPFRITAPSDDRAARAAAAAKRSCCTAATVLPSSAAASATCGVSTIGDDRVACWSATRCCASRCRPSASTTIGLPARSTRASNARPQSPRPEPGPNRDDARAIHQRFDRRHIDRPNITDALHHDFRTPRQYRGHVFRSRDHADEPGADPQRRFRSHRGGAAHAAVAAHDQHVARLMFVRGRRALRDEMPQPAPLQRFDAADVAVTVVRHAQRIEHDIARCDPARCRSRGHASRR